MTELQEQGQRLSIIIDMLGLNQSSMAQSLGFNSSFISMICNGKSALSGSFLKKFTNTYTTVNIRWLITGEGEMILENEPKDVGQFDVVNEPPAEYQPRSITAAVFGDLMALFESLERRIEALEQQQNQKDGTK